MTDPYAEPARPAEPDPADATESAGESQSPVTPAPAPVAPTPRGSSAGALGRTVAGIVLLVIAFGAGYVVGNSRLADQPAAASASGPGTVAAISPSRPAPGTDGATFPTITQPPASGPVVPEPSTQSPSTQTPATAPATSETAPSPTPGGTEAAKIGRAHV